MIPKQLNEKEIEYLLLCPLRRIKCDKEEYRKALRKLGEMNPEMGLAEFAGKLNKSPFWLLQKLWYKSEPEPTFISAKHVEPSKENQYKVVCCTGHPSLKVGDYGYVLDYSFGNKFLCYRTGLLHSIQVEGDYITLEIL